MRRMRSRRGAWSLVVVFLSVVAACGGSQRKATPPPQPEPPLSPELVAKVEENIFACDKGSVHDCYVVAITLQNAHRLKAAAAAYEFGCHLGERAIVGEYDDTCQGYEPGSYCNAETCANCKPGDSGK